MAMLISLGLGQATERLLGWPPSVLPPALAFSTVFAALAMLAKVSPPQLPGAGALAPAPRHAQPVQQAMAPPLQRRSPLLLKRTLPGRPP